MNRRQFSRTAMAAFTLGAAGHSVAQAEGSVEQSSVYPQVGGPGDRFSFIASGFRSNEQVGIWINRPDGQISTKGIEPVEDASEEGRVSWSWQAPEDGPLGFWQMVAQGIKSGRQVVLTFELRKQAPQQAAANINPRVGRGGTLFIFYASGFLLDEDIAVWANTPDGKAVEVELDRSRLYLGRFDGSWTAPVDAKIGAWQLVVYGTQSKITQVLDFRIEAPRP